MSKVVTGTRSRHATVVSDGTPRDLHVVAVLDDTTGATLQMRGDLDLAGSAVLAEVLHGHLARGDRFVRADLSGVGFLDCTGLKILMRAHNDFLAAGGALTLTGVGGQSARILALTELDRALLMADAPADRGSDHVADNRPAQIRSCGQPRQLAPRRIQ